MTLGYADRLLALGIARWPGTTSAGDSVRSCWAMLTYILLVTLYLLYLGIGGEWVGRLLWPAAALHAVLAFPLASAWVKSRQAQETKP